MKMFLLPKKNRSAGGIEYRSLLAIGLVFNYLLLQWTDNPAVHIFVGIYTCLYILITFPLLKGMIAKMSYALLGATVLLLIRSEDAFSLLAAGSITNLSIVCILVLTPLLGIPVRVGNYIESLQRLLKRLGNKTGLSYMIFLLLNHILSVVLNMGSIVISQHLLQSSNFRSKRLIATVLIRGFTTTATWSPYLAIMILVIGRLDIEWISFIPYTIGFVILSLLLAVLAEGKYIRDEKMLIQESPIKTVIPSTGISKRKGIYKLLELASVLLISTGLVLAAERLTSMGMVQSISIVAIVFPLFWCVITGRIVPYQEEMRRHLTKGVPNLQGEFVLFLIAGLFSYVFVRSSISGVIVDGMEYVFGSYSFLFGLILSLVMIGLGIAGLHPVVLLTVFSSAVDPELFGLRKEQFALLLLGSASIANNISPSTAVNNLLSKELRVNLFTISFRWNWRYALLLLCVLHIYLQIVFR